MPGAGRGPRAGEELSEWLRSPRVGEELSESLRSPRVGEGLLGYRSGTLGVGEELPKRPSSILMGMTSHI